MGRSAYLCPQSNCLQAARQRNRLGRALKTTVPDQIYTQLQARLTAGADRQPESNANECLPGEIR